MAHECFPTSGCHFEDPAFFGRELQEATMIGTTVSHYRIIEKLGEGGMGVVYKAEDIQLKRTVALKFLPDRVNKDSTAKERFLQEAQAAAALNHPNICTIHGVEDVDGSLFIVMEYLEGKTLQEMKHNVPLKQAIEIGIQLADGLAAAHEKGIVHRDLKPENIMICKDGRVQIMDFGLAKLKGATRLTKEGSTVGTAGYMSPEQVQGQETDHRTDIFSLGVVLYELIAGVSPFKGMHETAIAYEIVNVDPAPMTTIKQDLNPELDLIVFECLQKEPDERHQSVKDVSKELKRFKRESGRQRLSGVTTIHGAYTPAPQDGVKPITRGVLPLWLVDRIRSGSSFWLGMAILFLCAFIASVIIFSGRSSSIDSEVLRMSILPPDHHGFSHQYGGGQMAISPDGRKIAFVAFDSAGTSALWVRPLDALTGTRLPGTEEALFPFWSPDSRYIGFFTHVDTLKKISATGGPTFTITTLKDEARGASFNEAGDILLPLEMRAPLSLVSDAGGRPKPITRLDTALGERLHRWPFFLPDGKHFLYFSRTGNATSGNEREAICVASLDGKVNKRLLSAVSNAAYAQGHVIYVSGENNVLTAQPFDLDLLELKGTPVPIGESIQFNRRFGLATFSISRSGILVYARGSGSTERELMLADPRGKKKVSSGKFDVYTNAQLSRDATKIAIELWDPRPISADIWIYEINRDLPTRFTFDTKHDLNPVWSPDGSRIVFCSNRKGHFDLYEKISTGAANEKLIWESAYDKFPTDWSPDGKFILFQSSDPKSRFGVWLLRMTGERKAEPLLQNEHSVSYARFSPDMKWIAYQSDESETNQIYVTPFRGPGTKRQVSSSGGESPSWHRDGNKIFFLIGGQMMVAEVNGSKSAFETRKVSLYFDPSRVGGTDILDISRDGQSILLRPIEQTFEPLTVVVNWNAELKKKREAKSQ